MSNGQDGGGSTLGEAVAGVWAARTAPEVALALARNNSFHAAASVRFFRAAVRWRFPAPCDPREVSRVLGGWLAQLPPYAAEKLALREAEAFIRAEMNGETDLVGEIPIDSLAVRDALMMVTRFAFEEAVANPAAFEELRRITAQVAADHRALAVLTDLKLERIYAWRDLSLAEFNEMVDELDSVRWS
jgi:hypothetical protein